MMLDEIEIADDPAFVWIKINLRAKSEITRDNSFVATKPFFPQLWLYNWRRFHAFHLQTIATVAFLEW